jgi:DeoR/GlpR family transcriptional regulator of sugar metabolism
MSDWIELLNTDDETEVQIVKNILEAEGIQVVVDSMKIRPYPVRIGKIGEIKLLVRKESLEEAEKILKIMGGDLKIQVNDS